MARRPRPPRPAVRLAVAGCVIFGMGVVVGALLGPLARPKAPASPPPPERTKASAPTSSTTAATPQEPSGGAAGKAEPLTFFQALKEVSPQAEKPFVPFKPTDEAPPALEALVPKEAPRPKAPTVEVPPPPPPEAPRPKVVEPKERYYVGVAAFQFKENARRLTLKLQQQGYDAAWITTTGRQRNQVRVGP
ncbi:MAG: SPOR domain-containing protein, partial [Nitrospinota bacterium]